MPFGRSRKFPEHRNRPDRPPDQFARAVRANTLEDLIGAVSTEGAFKAADAGLNALRRKITVATLTIRLQLQHRLPSGASSRRTIVEVSGARETEAIIPSPQPFDGRERGQHHHGLADDLAGDELEAAERKP